MSHHQPSSNNVFPSFWYQKFGGFFRRNRKNSRIYTRTNNFFPKAFPNFPKKQKHLRKNIHWSLTKFVVFPRKKLGKFWNFLLYSVNSTFFFFFWGKNLKVFKITRLRENNNLALLIHKMFVNNCSNCRKLAKKTAQKLKYMFKKW